MPRKFKTAFAAADADRAITGIHDGAFIAARARDRRTGGARLQMRVGGGTSIMPRVAPVLYEFLGADDGEYLKVMEAVLRIFNRQEELRTNRARARIKVLVDRYRHRRLPRAGRGGAAGRLGRRTRLLDRARCCSWTTSRSPRPRAAPGARSPTATCRSSTASAPPTSPQRQQGFVTVEVGITRGDLTPEQFRGLAAIMREYSGGYARTTVQQNLVLRWVREESVYEVWKALVASSASATPARARSTDVVSCPGTDSCKLGITSSMGLNEALRERFEALAIDRRADRKLNIKMSGCPNGCSQHHIASIGFYRRLDQGRGPHDPRLHPPRRRAASKAAR